MRGQRDAKDGRVNCNKGFTVIELMAVVAIVSILALVAIASYADFMTRGKVSEAMVFAAEAKIAVAAYYDKTRKLPKSNHQAGLPDPDSYDRYDYIRKLELSTTDPLGVVTITFKIPGNNADNKELQLIPTTREGRVTWTCLPSRENGIDVNQVPPNCRG
jgi:type IV pilus assembly protein PilA